MKKVLLSLVAVAGLMSFDTSARCCKRERVVETPVTYATAAQPAFVEACAEPAAPICKVPCVTYKQVPAIRHVTYSCPSSCLVGDEGVSAHADQMRSSHDGLGVKIEVTE
jgi:hypothetical protein